VADDGVAGRSPSSGLTVRAAGINPTTGSPAFTASMAQEDDKAFGLPGQLDHFKWVASANRPATSGWPGYDAEAGRELVVEASLAGETFGTGGHPFGPAVADPDDDLRLGALATMAFDVETQLGFGFVLTNRRVHAWYERRPFARNRLGHPSPSPCPSASAIGPAGPTWPSPTTAPGPPFTGSTAPGSASASPIPGSGSTAGGWSSTKRRHAWDGSEVDDDDVSHLGPTMTEHINCHGRYHFKLDRRPKGGAADQQTIVCGRCFEETRTCWWKV